MSIVEPDDWTLAAKCRGMEDDLFPEAKDQKRVRALCQGCPVRTRCLVEALDHRIEWGVWGGLTERERRTLLRQRPEVESWSELLLGEPGLTSCGELDPMACVQAVLQTALDAQTLQPAAMRPGAMQASASVSG